MIDFQKSIKTKNYNSIRIIDLQKTWGERWLLLTRSPKRAGLDANNEVAVHGHIAVGHARCVERKAGVAAAVEEDEAAGGVSSFAKKVNGFAGGEIGGGQIARVG